MATGHPSVGRIGSLISYALMVATGREPRYGRSEPTPSSIYSLGRHAIELIKSGAAGATVVDET